jgi:hypothetical protein
MPFDWKQMDGLDYLVGLIVFVSVYSAYVLASRLYGKETSQRKCRWVRDPIQPQAMSTRWICKTCLESGFTQDRNAPKICKLPIKTRL